MALDYCPFEEVGNNKQKKAETFQSKVIVVSCIKLVNTFLALCAVTDSMN